ncbi:MAG TPA: filamentous hemagglutinin N-terminal domain-containing protein [Oculatellaceae cyanobacterium]|jgi:filamentous hemagglutinin family protein
MTNIQNYSTWCWKLGIAGNLVIFNIAGQWQDIAQAQIVIDSTLGNEHSIVTPKITVNNLSTHQINGGAIRGTNLFHSFLEFNVANDKGVYFNNPINIKNIFTRITGNNPSNILGTLGINGAANLFLINPNGILFGKNARLDVQGSFLATTANSIQFGNQGFFSASPENIPGLLTVNPSALLFNQIANNSIINQSTLQVPDGRSLLLLGGNIFLDGGKLKAPGGRIELAGLAIPGTIGLNLDGHDLQINSSPATLLADISLRNNSLIDASGRQENSSNSTSLLNTRGGNIELQGHYISISNNSKIIADTFDSQDGGKINIQASELRLQNGAAISASTFGSGRGGNLNVTASQAIELTGFGGFGTLEKIQTKTFNPADIQNGLFALSFGTGVGGNIEIDTPKLILRNGAATVASTFGSGQGGSLTINANELVDASKSLIFAGTLGSGNAGNLLITTNKLILTNLAAVETTTHGKGKAGTLTVNASDTVEVVGSALDANYPSIVTGIYANSTPLPPNIEIGDAGELTINTSRLILRDGGEIGAGTFGKGQGGSLTINATDSVEVTGALPTPFNYPSSLFAISTGAGDAGKLLITTKRLSVRDGGTISTGTFNSGNGGSLVVNASDIVELAGSSATSQLGIDAGFYYVGSRFPSILITNSNGTGNAGDLTIVTNKLIVRDLAQIEASTQAHGRAGTLTVNASDSVEVIGSQLYPGNLDLVSGIFADSTPPSENINAGDAGELTINTNRLIVRDGGEIGAGTSGIGKGGNITINARDSVEVMGATPDEYKLPSTIYTDTYGVGDAGDAGDLRITTGRLTLENGGMIAAGTSNSGTGGNLIVNALDSIELTGSSPTTQAAIDAGFYYTGSRFPSSLITSSSGSGDAGTLTINTNKLIVSNQAQVALSGSGSGNAGNLEINAQFLQVQNIADVIATTTSGEGGNMKLETENLQLRDRGKISTTAGGSGNGGNLTLNTDTLVAINNSELSANAFLGRGGKIEINSQGVFRGVDSKITASSQLGINGVVEINNFGIDPSKGLTNLPVEILNVTGLIDQSCSSNGREVGSQLSVTGRGGLPANPQETLNGQTVLTDLATPSETSNLSSIVSHQISHPHPQPSLIEATGWEVNKQGEVILTAYAHKVTPHAPWQKSPSCQD